MSFFAFKLKNTNSGPVLYSQYSHTVDLGSCANLNNNMWYGYDPVAGKLFSLGKNRKERRARAKLSKKPLDA